RPVLGEPFRADGRSGPAQTPTQTPYDLAPGRSLSENRWPDGLSVARRRRRGRGPRRAGPDKEEQTGGAQFAVKRFEEIWLCPKQARHRKAEILCRRSQSSWNRKTPRAWPMAQQSSGEFASANPTKGEEDARVQERGIHAKIW